MTAALLPLLLTVASADAAPPSSTLTGTEGTLSWQIAESGDRVEIAGTSPRWTVAHTAHADLRPIRTERTDADGARHTVTYDAGGATVVGPGGTERLDQSGLWDADTVDVRLGQLVADGEDLVTFKAIDLSGPKVYGFRAEVAERTACGAVPCAHVKLQLSGMLRHVGPTWHYWYADDGRLLGFDGPAGTFHVGGAR